MEPAALVAIPQWFAAIMATASVAALVAGIRWSIDLDKRVALIAQSLTDELRPLKVIVDGHATEIVRLRDHYHEMASKMSAVQVKVGMLQRREPAPTEEP